MPANSTHPDYDASLPAWLRARDVIAGEDAVKAGGIKYLPRLDFHPWPEKPLACCFTAAVVKSLLFADLQKETKATKNSSFSSRSSVQYINVNWRNSCKSSITLAFSI